MITKPHYIRIIRFCSSPKRRPFSIDDLLIFEHDTMPFMNLGMAITEGKTSRTSMIRSGHIHRLPSVSVWGEPARIVNRIPLLI